VCSSSLLTYSGITALWQACVCPKEEDDEWHPHRCLLGECDICGVQRQLSLCPEEEFGQRLIPWKCYETSIIGYNEDTREVRKRIRESYKETLAIHHLSEAKPPSLHKAQLRCMLAGCIVFVGYGDARGRYHPIPC
jgi:hypothetical protein